MLLCYRELIIRFSEFAKTQRTTLVACYAHNNRFQRKGRSGGVVVMLLAFGSRGPGSNPGGDTGIFPRDFGVYKALSHIDSPIADGL